MWGSRSSRTFAVSAAIAVFAVCSVLPVAYMVAAALTFDRGAASALLLDPRQRQLLFNTTLLGLGTAALATLLGATLGMALARVPLAAKPVLRIALAAPVVLPSYVVALAWTYFSRNVMPEWTYSLPGAIVVLSVLFYPIAMLATEAALLRVDARLEEAALIVASPRRVLGRITLALASPGIAASALVVFVLAISDFAVPGILRVRAYTTEVFTAFAALYDVERAVLLALPLLLLSILISACAAVLLEPRLITTRRSVATPPVLFAGWRRPATVMIVSVIAIALVLPLMVLAREAIAAQSARAILAGSGEAVLNSVTLSALGATAVTVVAVTLGYARARAGRRSGLAADVLFLTLFAVPSTIVGVGLIGVWNRPGAVGALYGTDVMFVLAYLARFVPVAALILAASTRAVPVSHEEAASVSGAGWFRAVTRIVLPQMKVGVAAAWVITFILAFGELGASILVAPAGEATLPIRIYTIIANTPPSHIAALALLQAAVIFVPLAALGSAASFAKLR